MIKCEQCDHEPFESEKGKNIHMGMKHPKIAEGEEKTYVPCIFPLDLNSGAAPDKTTSDRQDATDNNLHKRMYKVEEWGRAAVDAIARSCTSSGYHLAVKPYAADKVSPMKVNLIDKFLENVNEEDHIEDLIYDIVLDMYVFGEAFVRVFEQVKSIPLFNLGFDADEYDVMDYEDFPFRLYMMDAEEVEIVTDGKNITGYIQNKNGTKVAEFTPEEVIHFKYPGPGCDVRGMAPFKTLQNAMATDLLSSEYNSDFFSNNATPRLHIDLGIVGKKELQAFVARAGVELKGHPHSSLVTTGGAKITPISFKNKDAEFDVFSKRLRERILAVLGVPPAVLGLAEDYKDLAHQISLYTSLTVRPIQRLIGRRLNRKVIRRFFKKTPVDIEFNPITSLDVEAYVLQVDSDIKNLIRTRNEVRAERGLPPVKGGDVFLIPYSNAEIAVLPDLENPPKPEDNNSENETDDETDE